MELRIDVSQLEGLHGDFQKMYATAFKSAFRKTAKTAVNAVEREAVDIYAGSYKVTKSRIRGTYIRGAFRDGAQVQDTVVALQVSGKAIPLSIFSGVRQTKAGVRVPVDGGFKTVAKSFEVNGQKLFFKRTKVWAIPTKGRYAGKMYKRGPNSGKPYQRQMLEKMWAVPAHAIFRKEGAQEKLHTTFVDRFHADFASNMSFYLGREGFKYVKKVVG